MAKQLAALLGGMDMQRLAELVRQQGRGKDTVLAHITPKEAMMLKANGGAGTVNPVTGLPEFQDYGFLGGYEDLAPASQQGLDNQNVFAPETISQPIDMSRSLIYSDPTDTMEPGQTSISRSFAPEYSQIPIGGFGFGATEPQFGLGMYEGEMVGPPQVRDVKQEAIDQGIAPQRGIDDLLKAGAKQVFETKLGAAGLGTLASVLQARQAGRQARRMQQELSALGQPQRQMGEEMMRLGQAGQVTPVQRQQLEALAARERQQLAQRGLTSGTAQQQAEARQVERTQRAAQDLLDQGIKIAGIGNQYQAAAIKAGYAADQTTRELLNKTIANLYATIYGNVQPTKG